MKHIIIIVVIATFISTAFAPKQVDYKPFELALKTSNAKGLGQYFDVQVELTIKGGDFNIQNSYSKSQAQAILVNFFKAHKVKTFETKHSGSSSWSKYIIGYLETKEGRYRSLIRYLNDDGELTIQELELTEEDEY